MHVRTRLANRRLRHAGAPPCHRLRGQAAHRCHALRHPGQVGGRTWWRGCACRGAGVRARHTHDGQQPLVRAPGSAPVWAPRSCATGSTKVHVRRARCGGLAPCTAPAHLRALRRLPACPPRAPELVDVVLDSPSCSRCVCAGVSGELGRAAAADQSAPPRACCAQAARRHRAPPGRPRVPDRPCVHARHDHGQAVRGGAAQRSAPPARCAPACARSCARPCASSCCAWRSRAGPCRRTSPRP